MRAELQRKAAEGQYCLINVPIVIVLSLCINISIRWIHQGF